MRVEFTKRERNGRVACVWSATPRKRATIPGTHMAAGQGLPHDLVQYVVEAATGTVDGFWGLVGRDATFRSIGRKATKPGRAIIREHRESLDRSEVLANTQYAAWRAGDGGPVADALDAALAQWLALPPDDSLVFDWPSPVGTVKR